MEVAMNFRVGTIAVMIASLGGDAMTHAVELTVVTGQGNPPGVNELAAAFARQSGYKVTVIQETGKALEHRLSNGPADLVTGNPGTMDELLKKGQIVAGTLTPYMRASLGVAVRAGAPKPDISTVEAYRKALLAAKSIGYSRGCSGQNVERGIAQLGLTEQLKPKIVLTGGGTGPVTFFLARGDFELGIQQSNIMAGAPGTDFVGPVPPPVNFHCPSSVGVLTVSREREAAQEMIKFMISPAAAPLLRKVHEEPAKG
jgi:molybdate transport system substrate-binding protein